MVNVASKCGLTPQYTALEKLAQEYGRARADRRRRALQPVHGPGAGQRRGDPDVLLDHLRRDVPVAGQNRRQRRRPAPAVRRADPGRRRRRGRRRHPVELREVPARPGRHGGQPVPAPHRARRARGHRGHRGGPARLSDGSGRMDIRRQSVRHRPDM